MDALAEALDRSGDSPTIVCLQAGELSSGAFDPFGEACALARARGAWTHVDGAFGLWGAASPRLRHLTAGVDQADSWVTDGHKWLNSPYDLGFAFVAHPEPHRASMTASGTTYFAYDVVGRDEMDWNPEWSRRARGFAAYAALRSLGRQGIAELVERSARDARTLVSKLGQLPDAEVLAEPIINQGLVRFLARDGDHDRRTDAVIERVQSGGEAWFGGTTWRGKRAMRVSVCSWRTTDQDVDRAVRAIRAALNGVA
jgi:glutamate/tyrosine decarboxylase-like PLP-dependent enzyme